MPVTIGPGSDAFRRNLSVQGREFGYFSLAAAEAAGLGHFARLPVSLKVVLENLLRNRDGSTVRDTDVQAFSRWLDAGGRADAEIAYRPARVLMQDFTGVPAVVDLAAMRDAMRTLGGDPTRINPLVPVDLVIDHSVMVDAFGTPRAFRHNVAREYERNGERYKFLKWGQGAFRNFRVVPPGTGICHQVNLEYLASTIRADVDGEGRPVALPDTLVGTDSHTTMVNGLAVLGWGVGGIEAEAAMLGQPISMLIPEVVGVYMTGTLREGITATDLVLSVTERLRRLGVVGKFVEFHGPGLDQLPLADRATIANMAPEYGATCGFFPVDEETLRYLRDTGRDDANIALVEAYAKANGMWRDAAAETVFSDRLEIDLAGIEPCIAGPKRPQDRVPLSAAATAFEASLAGATEAGATESPAAVRSAPVAGAAEPLSDGDVVIAAITSCTNTSNPHVLVAAGLVARRARERGLTSKPWVKTSLAPGSKVVTDYLARAGLQADLDALGFHLVGYGCTTCIGNSGPLPEPIAEAVTAGDLTVCSVLSGNRNFEGRVSPQVKANYLASPPLVVAYALAGTLRKDITREPLGQDRDGRDVHLRDLWPTRKEVSEIVAATVTRDAFLDRYADVFTGDEAWQQIEVSGGLTYAWPEGSTYVQNPPYFRDISPQPGEIEDVVDARILAVLGDSITTDHISPAGTIKTDSPAGTWLRERQVGPRDFNSYGSRRGNHQVMMRGTFGNIRIRNEMLTGVEGGFTRMGAGDPLPIYDAAMRYRTEGAALVVIAGREYGTGSSRDWAAKGTRLLGVRAVIAESFERIHRSNLVGMGVAPLEFPAGVDRRTLGLTGDERVTIRGLAGDARPRQTVAATFTRPDGTRIEVPLCSRIDTDTEMQYLRNGGVLHYVLRHLARAG